MYNPFLQFADYLRYREAVKRADKAHEETGERYYVMPVNITKDAVSGKPKLIIMDRANFRKLKQKHYISQSATQRDMLYECFYCTPYRDGHGYLDAKGRRIKLFLYFSYCKATRKLFKEYKHAKRKDFVLWNRLHQAIRRMFGKQSEEGGQQSK